MRFEFILQTEKSSIDFQLLKMFIGFTNNTSLGVYKKDEVAFCEPDPEEIVYIMNRIIHLDKLLMTIDNEEV